MSDFTPGPWKYEPGMVSHLGHTVWDGKGMRICCCGYGSFDESNAKLIAAAPDLFAACEMLLDWDGYGGDAVSMLTEAVEAARAAVEKAKESNDE